MPSQIQNAAKRQQVELPDFWKGAVALHLVSSWARDGTSLTDHVLDTFASLFDNLSKRFEDLNDWAAQE